VPAACAAGFEKFVGIDSKMAGFHDGEGKHDGAEHNKDHFN
jgi:hypothetical protein